jgi:hypothetical protein
MNAHALQLDLVVLTADKNMKTAVQGLLDRPKDMGIRSISVDIYVHPERDPGCRLRADAFLRPFVNKAAHAIVMFDREGCGKQKISRKEMESDVTSRLSRSGWGDRSACIAIEPELENWVFSNSPEVDIAVGWLGKTPRLRTWLEERSFLMPNHTKPSRPKEAMEAALRHVRLPRSSSIYLKLAERVSLGRCKDDSFLNFKNILQSWFPVPDEKQR